MRRSLTLVSTWIVATVAAVGLAWAGVGLVADQVAEPVRPVPTVVARSSSEPTSSESPSPTAGETPSPTPQPTIEAPDSARTDDDAAEPEEPVPSRPAGSSGVAPSSEPSPRPSPSADESEEHDDHEDGREDDGHDEEEAAETRSYRLVGGTVTISFSASRVEVVVPATPAEGFGVSIERESATDLRIEFSSDDHESRLDVWWDDGPRDETREESDD